MGTRLAYALPIARELVTGVAARLRGRATPSAAGDGSPFIIVTGSGRSGTSAVARVLHESGLPMGMSFDPASEVNPTGFYEDIEVRALNRQIVAELGRSDLRRPARWPWRATVRAVARPHARRMAELAQQPVAGWKDPLFCMTLEAWLPHLPRRPKVVVCLRNPESYLNSLTNIVGLVQRESVERWWANDLQRLLDILRDGRLEATCIEYDALIANTTQTVAALSRFVGRPLDAQYVVGGLRRFEHRVPQRYAKLYEEVRALGANGSRPARAVPPNDWGERYAMAARAIEERVAAAQLAWAGTVGMPQPALHSESAVAGARAATLPFVALLSESQAEIATLAPPPQLEDYHELLRAAVDQQRLAAQLLLRALGVDAPEPEVDRTLVADAITVWRRFCSPEASAKAARKRAPELEGTPRAPAP